MRGYEAVTQESLARAVEFLSLERAAANPTATDREDELRHLRAKVESLPAIEQAKGVLIAQEGCSDERAFDILRRASQRENRKVREIAAEVVDGARRRARSARHQW